MAITQNITAIPKAGKRGIDTRDAFVIKQEAFQDALTDTFVTEINAFREQANTLETNVNNKEASATQSATTATTKASEASSSATSALASRNAAKTSETNASASEVLAGKWANENENVIVQSGKYSAKHYALKAEEFMNMSEAVTLTGTQTIAGAKTFSSSPIVPVPTTDTQAANKQYVDYKTIINSFTNKPTPVDTDNLAIQETGGLLKKLSFANLMNWVKSFSFGWGQTWQNVTASRTIGVTYTNNTNKSIYISASAAAENGNTYLILQVDGVEIYSNQSTNLANMRVQISGVILAGSTYKITTSVGVISSLQWAELI